MITPEFRLYLSVLLLFLTSCTVIEEPQIEVDSFLIDGPRSALLIASDEEIGPQRLDEFKELQIEVFYLAEHILNRLDDYEIIYIGSQTLDVIDAAYLHRWRDTGKLIVGMDTQPTTLVERLSIPDYKASPQDLDMAYLPPDKFMGSAYIQTDSGWGISQDFFPDILYLHYVMIQKYNSVYQYS